MAEIRWTEEACRWLEDIYKYIAMDNPKAASQVISGIYEKIQTLHQFQGIGYRYRIAPEGEIRIMLYGHYRIAYLLKNSSTVEILGVFHGALDIEKYLV